MEKIFKEAGIVLSPKMQEKFNIYKDLLIFYNKVEALSIYICAFIFKFLLKKADLSVCPVLFLQ